MDFSFAALTASGDTVRGIDLFTTWHSTDPSVFTVEANGLATGQQAGEAYCIIEATDEPTAEVAGLKKRLRFVGRDSAFVMVF